MAAVHVDYPPWLVDSLEQEARWDPEEEDEDEEEGGADGQPFSRGIT